MPGDEEGQVIAHHDAEPDQWRQPTSHWKLAQTVQDVHRLELPPQLAPGRYEIRVGMYLEATMERLVVVDGPVGVEPNAIVIGYVQIAARDNADGQVR